MVWRNLFCNISLASFYDYLNDFTSLCLFGSEPIEQEIFSNYEIFCYDSFSAHYKFMSINKMSINKMIINLTWDISILF